MYWLWHLVRFGSRMFDKLKELPSKLAKYVQPLLLLSPPTKSNHLTFPKQKLPKPLDFRSLQKIALFIKKYPKTIKFSKFR
jgi:hypothetical protein